MCEEGAAKLRLKPRTAPAARGRERSPGPESPPRRLTSADSPWFEKEDLNECEKTWILLLKDIGHDLHCTNWDTVPSYPEFLEKSAEEEGPGHQEVFTAGMKEFQWVSFPSFHQEKCLNPADLSSQQPPQGQAENPPSLSCTAEETCRGAGTDRGSTAAGEGTQGIPALQGSPKSRELPGHTSPAQPLAQSSGKACPPQQQHTGTAQNRTHRTEHGKQELPRQLQQGRIPAGEEGPVPAEEPGSCQQLENQSEGSSALDSCPMCLMQFSGTLSQLDIDGHLAKCLSESADDVTW